MLTTYHCFTYNFSITLVLPQCRNGGVEAVKLCGYCYGFRHSPTGEMARPSVWGLLKLRAKASSIRRLSWFFFLAVVPVRVEQIETLIEKKNRNADNKVYGYPYQHCQEKKQK